MQWWHEQNPKRRHLWPGNNTARVKPWPAKEIISQIDITRRHKGVTGNIHWNLSALADNRGGIATLLQRGAYSKLALPPASPWLDSQPPLPPVASAQWDVSKKFINVSWRATRKDTLRWWIFQMRERSLARAHPARLATHRHDPGGQGLSGHHCHYRH